MEPLSVNDVFDQQAALVGQPVVVSAVLAGEPGALSLQHFPRAESRTPSGSKLWLDAGTGLSVNFDALSRWVSKRVQVSGYLIGENPYGDDMDYLNGRPGLWFAAESIKRI